MEIIQFIHKYWAYLVFIALAIATFNALIKFFGDKEFDAKDFRLSLFALITMHLQLLIGVVLFFTKDYFGTIEQVGGMGEVMNNSVLRDKIVEHPTMMIIAIALLTIGYSKHKRKLTSKSKFKMLAIFYTLALILVVAKIPWDTFFSL